MMLLGYEELFLSGGLRDWKSSVLWVLCGLGFAVLPMTGFFNDVGLLVGFVVGFSVVWLLSHQYADHDDSSNHRGAVVVDCRTFQVFLGPI